MIAKSKEVNITTYDFPQTTQLIEDENELKQNKLEQELWSKHERDVGLVRSANPIKGKHNTL